jgi:hypothetical protein
MTDQSLGGAGKVKVTAPPRERSTRIAASGRRIARPRARTARRREQCFRQETTCVTSSKFEALACASHQFWHLVTPPLQPGHLEFIRTPH